MLPKLLAQGSKGGPAEETARAMILATPPETAMADLAGMAVRSEAFDVLGSFGGPILIAVGAEGHDHARGGRGSDGGRGSARVTCAS